MTGRGRLGGVGSYDADNPNLRVSNGDIVASVLDPSDYGPGAQWRLTLDYDF